MRTIFLTSILGILLLTCTHQHQISEEEKQAILSELNEIKELDQQYAGIPPAELMEEYGHKRAWEIFKAQKDSVGLVNQSRIKSLYTKYGFLGVQKVGEEAASDFWLPIQHADNDPAFQEEMLEAMAKEIEKGSADQYRYAMLEDRVNVNLNRPQRFGSQVTYNEYGQAIPKIGLVDETIVDSLREAYTLPPLTAYYNGMTEMHFEINKKLFLEKGITEPQLYE